jgi:two-component system chemotaxis response regulator CheB
MKKDFFIAAIGASAGGLPALKAFFNSVPEKSGIAYVVLTHLPKRPVSTLGHLLSKHTSLPVIRLTEDTPVKPDHIYVLIENTMVTIQNGIILIRERREDEIINHSVNIFLCSLAVDRREKAVGIVLSGGGSDGLEGVKQISKNGGYVMIQTPESAEVSGMPESIARFDHPAVTATPGQLPGKLLEWVKHQDNKIN